MHTMTTGSLRMGAAVVLTFALVLLSSCAPPVGRVAPPLPPGAPPEDARFASEWPSPNGDLYNTRVAHSTISSANVSQLGIAWTLPLQGAGTNGADVANPLMADGIA
jgi:hypothetical protein